MKEFLKKILFFTFIFVGIVCVGLLLPATPRSSQSLLFGEIEKDSLFTKVPSPRIVFIGGSNLSFGINSQMIKDSLGLNPVNTAIHASIGLVYMLDHSLNYIRPGDILIVSPEYQQFYGNFAYGKEELLRTVWEVNSLHDVGSLRMRQWYNMAEFLPALSFSKFKTSEYFNIRSDSFYSKNSFNRYGDVYTYWDKREGTKFPVDLPITDGFNGSMVKDLEKYREKVREKGATLLVTFPGYQSSSFHLNKKQVEKVQTELKEAGFTLLGSPERYKMPDSLLFNTPYHLLKEGVDIRTRLLIEDIRNSHVRD